MHNWLLSYKGLSSSPCTLHKMTGRTLRFCWWYGVAVIYFWCFANAALQAYRHPFLNWDMVAYMGVVESFSTSNPQKIHDATMERARQVYDPSAYYHHRYENILSNRPEAFYQQLPLYSIKPLYTGGVWLLHVLGMAMPEATYVLSIGGFLDAGRRLLRFCAVNAGCRGLVAGGLVLL